MISFKSTLALISLLSLAKGLTIPQGPKEIQAGSALEKRWATQTSSAKRSGTTCVVNSVATASNLSGCTYVEIKAFTVPSGETVTIAAAKGATVVMAGNVVFEKTTASGPLFTIDTDDVVFNGGKHSIDGNGADYWDGKGSSGGTTKPHPFVKFKGYGTFEYVTVLNAPAQGVSVGTTGASVIQHVNVDDSAAGSLGKNTDGFDVSASDLTVSSVTVNNQDDCFAINKGSNIVIEDSTCIGSHGISIGSVAGSDVVSNVTIARNTITGGQNGLRIKIDSDATGASVSNVVYESNVISNITKYGVLITQSYPDSFSTPGTHSTISGISFTGGTTTVSVGSSAYGLAIDCGHCTGTWNFAGLDFTSKGKGHDLVLSSAKLSGGTY